MKRIMAIVATKLQVQCSWQQKLEDVFEIPKQEILQSQDKKTIINIWIVEYCWFFWPNRINKIVNPNTTIFLYSFLKGWTIKRVLKFVYLAEQNINYCS